ncbi:helix-turn-helix domain-containing protein [Weissella paramesenteroides]|uniref:Helix-turn-helix domain-containing protein n=1 Tax=Weissella paramesenteroides TaxID=1249 RepID=A0ABD4XIT2_WEIPA|nr:helix-turn-helix domain-containing protein [Weissella paramesenteroides]MDF8368727.1 helix-turn-helix domain-containing protein [Weissella paramesenteroides]MDF8370880.1 helix-turn-helix domain-containing protein [Weissella paramesenteroides]
MNHYTQLTAFDRGRIEEMLQEHLSLHQIALKLHRSVSTISREIHRCIAINYKAENAHADYICHRKNSHCKRKLDNELLRQEIINDIQEKTGHQNTSPVGFP